MNTADLSKTLARHLEAHAEAPVTDLRKWTYFRPVLLALQEIAAGLKAKITKLEKRVSELETAEAKRREESVAAEEKKPKLLELDEYGDDLIHRIINVIHTTPHGIEVKRELAEIIIEFKPDAPVRSFLPKAHKAYSTRNWG